MPVAKCRSPHPQTNLSPAPLGKAGVHELPYSTGASLWPRPALPSAPQPSEAGLHKVQVKSSEGHTPQVLRRGSVEEAAP